MAQIIKYRAVIQDNWQLLERDSIGALPFSGDVIVPLDLWASEREALSFRLGRIGAWLEADADPVAIAPDLARFDVIAVRFASFTDAFALRADQNPEQALTAFDDFIEAYQTSVDRPAPLFRRRLKLDPQRNSA